jgi:hypothetical protein
MEGGNPTGEHDLLTDRASRRVLTDATRMLLALLLVAILSQFFLALVRRYLLALTLASTWHGFATP